MPIYEYRCEGCGMEFEVTQGMDDPPLVTCRSCSGRVHRLISSTSFLLKGGGWYADGYASGSKGNGSKGNGSGKEGKGNGSGGSTTSKGKEGSASPPTTTLGKAAD